VIGSSHRRGVGRTLFGSVAEGLLQGAPCPVAVAPPDYARRRENGLSNRITVGYDGGDDARAAAHAAADLAKVTGATVELIGVMRHLQPSPGRGPYLPLAREAVAEKLEAIAAELKSAPAIQTVLMEGEPAATLAERSAKADLLVVGSRGYGPVRRALLGSVSRTVIHSADCPVLVWPRAGDSSCGRGG
jgi:nucleotide-binding universal stress UspA family protein